MKDMEHEAELVSSMMDGALDEARHDGLLRALKQNPELVRCWERYHLIGDVMKNQLPTVMDAGFAARVSAAIDEEPTVFAPNAMAVTKKSSRSHVAGWAVAASVAVAAVVGVQMMLQPPQGGRDTSTLASSQVVSPVSQPIKTVHAKPEIARVDYSQPVNDAQLNQYMVNHNEYASGMNGVLPYARIVVSRSQ